MFANEKGTYGRRALLALLSTIFALLAFSAHAQLRLENELLLELRLDGGRLGLDVLGYQRGEDFLLSLNELTTGLGFPITVDGAAGTATGWYISEDRNFSLDLARASVTSNGKSWPLADGEVVVFQGGLYADTKALEKWFPLRLSAVIRDLYLDVEPTETLPIQRRFNRRERIVVSSGRPPPQYTLQDNPYQFFGPHVTKLRLGYSTIRQNPERDAEYSINYATLSRGDLGWMTSTLSLAGQSSDSLTGARLKLERSAFDGPLGLNHIEVGDVAAEGSRGLMLRGGDERFDKSAVTLEGSQLPDWDVELYQNEQLISTQTTGQEGRYLFEDVPLLFGENHFELKFFGPHGEIETRQEFHFLGVGMLDPGRINYEMAAVQSGRTVFGVNDADGVAERDSAVYRGDFSLGLSRNLTVGAGVRSQVNNGERLASSNVGFGLSTSRLYTSVRYFDTPNSQNSITSSLRTRFAGTNYNLAYTRFFEEPDLTNVTQKWRSSVNITSTVFSVPTKLEINNVEQENTSRLDAIIGTTTLMPGLGRFSSSLWYLSDEERLGAGTISTSQTGGQSSFHTTIRPWTFRLSSSYRFSPDSELLELSAASSLRIERDLTLDMNIRRNTTTDTTYYVGGVNWQLDRAAIIARVGYDSEERWTGLITLSTALVHRPGSLIPRLDSHASVDAGSVEAQVFERVDDSERAPQADVLVHGTQSFRTAETNQSGVAYLSRLPAYRQTDIEFDESTLTDPELKPENPGVSIIPRPGSYTVVEFPLIRTVELEGHVLVNKAGDEQPLSRALVLLKTPDGNVVAQRRTAFDGFFLFDGVVPGDYLLTLEEPLQGRLISGPDKLKVVGRSGVIRDLDFALNAAPAQSIALEGIINNETPQQRNLAIPIPPIPGIITNSAPDAEISLDVEREAK